MTEQDRQILISLRLQSAKETLAEIPIHIEQLIISGDPRPDNKTL